MSLAECTAVDALLPYHQHYVTRIYAEVYYCTYSTFTVYIIIIIITMYCISYCISTITLHGCVCLMQRLDHCKYGFKPALKTLLECLNLFSCEGKALDHTFLQTYHTQTFVLSFFTQHSSAERCICIRPYFIERYRWMSQSSKFQSVIHIYILYSSAQDLSQR